MYRGWFMFSHVAVKVLRSGKKQATAGFYQEIEHMWRYRHPNIVTVSLGGCVAGSKRAGRLLLMALPTSYVRVKQAKAK